MCVCKSICVGRYMCICIEMGCFAGHDAGRGRGREGGGGSLLKNCVFSCEFRTDHFEIACFGANSGLITLKLRVCGGGQDTSL